MSKTIQSGQAKSGLKVFLDSEQSNAYYYVAITKSLETSARANSVKWCRSQIEEGGKVNRSEEVV